MARSTIEVPFLGTQKLAFSAASGDVKIYKVFYGDTPDGITDHCLSVISMDVDESVCEEVFQSGATFEPMQLVKLTFEIERAGKQKGNNMCVHIEAVEPKSASRPQVSPVAAQHKTEPTKA